MGILVSVSYTHLDVYKRQLWLVKKTVIKYEHWCKGGCAVEEIQSNLYDGCNKKDITLMMKYITGQNNELKSWNI